jgi:hypothetical protein
MTSQKNVRNLILGKATSVDTGVPAAGTQVEPSNMADGAVVITDLSGKRITTLGSGEGLKGFCVVQGQGANKPLIKHSIKPGNITGAYLKNYSAATEQVSYIGYTGSTGALPTGGVDTTYYGAVVLQGEFLTFGAREMKKTFDFKCTTSDSAVDVATGLHTSIFNGVKRMADPYYRVERTSNGTLTDFSGTATMVKVTKGSKTVEAYVKAAATTTAVTASTFSTSVGDVWSFPSLNGKTFTFTAAALGTPAGAHAIYIGSETYYVADTNDSTANGAAIATAINASSTIATASAATGTVTITYKSSFVGLPPVAAYNTTDGGAYTFLTVTVASGDSTSVKYVAETAASSAATFQLDVPWQGETGYIVGGSTAASMTGTMSSITAWGIKLTGLPRTYEDITFRFYKIRFAVELFNMGSTTSTLSVAANEGSGMSEAIQWLESFTVGNEGAYYVIQPDQPLARRKNSLSYLGSGQGWNLITINYFDATTNNIIGGQKMEKSLTIAGVTGTNTQFSDSTGILGIIESITAVGDLGTWA